MLIMPSTSPRSPAPPRPPSSVRPPTLPTTSVHFPDGRIKNLNPVPTCTSHPNRPRRQHFILAHCLCVHIVFSLSSAFTSLQSFHRKKQVCVSPQSPFSLLPCSSSLLPPGCAAKWQPQKTHTHHPPFTAFPSAFYLTDCHSSSDPHHFSSGALKA